MVLQELNSDNYYSAEANRAWFSASQIKSLKKCEAMAVAEMRGEYVRPMSTALTVGQYVDEALTGNLDTWLMRHPEICKRDGTLKAEYMQAAEMVDRARRDPLFMSYMDGSYQEIMVGELFGVPFKAKFDVLGKGRIVDLKTTKDLKGVYVPGEGKLDFASAWDWPLQMAIYQKIVAENEGVKLPCYLAVITKETPADIAIVQIEQERMDAEMAWLETVMPRYEALKEGLIEPERCGHCAFCRETKKLTGAVMLGEYDENFGGIEG